MKSFNEHIYESASVHSLVDEFAKISDAKPLVLKYVMFFKDEKIRSKVEVMYMTHDDTFTVEGKGEYFRGQKRTTSNPTQAYNYVKQVMIDDDLSNPVSAALKIFISDKSSLEPWKEFMGDFIDYAMKNKVNVTKEDANLLEISDTLLTAKKFGI